mgnify:CR=1 FL=1
MRLWVEVVAAAADGEAVPDGGVFDLSFDWTDGDWTGRQLAGSVVYELHVGTFTPGGTFRAAIDKLQLGEFSAQAFGRSDTALIRLPQAWPWLGERVPALRGWSEAILMKPGLEWGVQMGTLISADQRDRVLQVRRAEQPEAQADAADRAEAQDKISEAA